MSQSEKRGKQDLDHQVWKIIKSRGLESKKILVALSGGVDSVALLVCLKKVHGKVSAAYVHHGLAANSAQTDYRDEAQLFCGKLCKDLEVDYYPLSVKLESQFHSEKKLRDERYLALREQKKTSEVDLIALAHHQGDLLETRLLRLLRGTGGQGLLAMETVKGDLFRPLLQVSKQELEQYLNKQKVEFFVDPSNQEWDATRNWLRQAWLPLLESRLPGASQALARSLGLIADELQDLGKDNLLTLAKVSVAKVSVAKVSVAKVSVAKVSVARVVPQATQISGISLSFYLSLTAGDRERLLAQYFLARGELDFSRGQLQEIVKRLDNPQKVFTFSLGAWKWFVNAQQIWFENTR